MTTPDPQRVLEARRAAFQPLIHAISEVVGTDDGSYAYSAASRIVTSHAPAIVAAIVDSASAILASSPEVAALVKAARELDAFHEGLTHVEGCWALVLDKDGKPKWDCTCGLPAAREALRAFDTPPSGNTEEVN